MFLCAASLTSAQTTVDKSSYNSGIFANVAAHPAATRIDYARGIYKVNCRRLPEAVAMKCISNIQQIAIDIHDLPLECAVPDMRADYYSVSRGYNQLSNKYYDDAIHFAQKHNMLLEQGIYMHRKAIYYFVYKMNVDASRYFLLSHDIFNRIGPNKVPNMGGYYAETSDFYYSIGDFDNARANLRSALKFQLPLSRTRINIINTIGLTYRNSGKYSTSLGYFKHALNLSRASKDSVWTAIVLGNIGSVYFMQHDYARALPLIEHDYWASIKYKLVSNAAIALLRLVRISIDGNDLNKAEKQLGDADKLLNSTAENVLTLRVDYFELKALLNERLGRVAQAIQARKSYEQLRDSLSRRDNIAAIERVRLQWETEKNRQELNRLKKDAEISNYKQNTIIVVLLLLIAITALIYNRQRLKAKKDKELLASEKRLVDEELKYATTALRGYTENLMQKNVLIENFKSELERLQIKSTHLDGANLLDKMTQAHIMTDDNWNEFKKLFTRVHPGFFYTLRNNYKNLSGTDIRLLALMKLRLNNRETAGMLGITTDGVKKARQRLRKKMELPADTDIEDIIGKI